MSRIATPDLAANTQIHAAGLGLINLFTSDLFDFIDNAMKKTIGKQWLTDLQINNLGTGEVNYRDPSVLLKELVNVGGTPLRKPISALVPKAQWKDFYNRLAEVLGSRHLWVHNDITTNSDELKSLAILIKKVSWLLELPVTTECAELLLLIDPEEPEEKPEADEPDEEPSEIVIAFQILTENEDAQVGSIVSGPYISHTYTLHLNGGIRDRRTDELLADLIDGGDSLGALLIARKPNGGRLRVTPEGVIAAYFGENWGYLGKIESKLWFPDHLNIDSYL
jgi:hypothetical protein